jgi:hypothetical protein
MAEFWNGGFPFVVCAIRSIASLALLIDWALILITKKSEKATDEEVQSLLVVTNGTTTQNCDSEYASIPTSGLLDSEGEEEEFKDRDKEIKEQQGKRLDECGGWLGYLKGFAVFLPYLWLKEDKLVMFYLFLRGVNVI